MREDENVVELVLETKGKFPKMTDVVQKNFAEINNKQKTYYDQNTRGQNTM